MAERVRFHVHLRGGGILLSDWVNRSADETAQSIGESLSQGHSVVMPDDVGGFDIIPCSQIRYVSVEVQEYDEVPVIPEPVLASMTIPRTGGVVFTPQPPLDGTDLRSDLAGLGGEIDDDVHFDDN